MSQVTSGTLTKEISSKRSAIELRLETKMKSFRQIEAQFISDLSEALEINPEEIRKIKLLYGCVRFIFDIPDEVAKKFKKALKTKTFSSKLKKLFETYSIDPRNTRFDVVEEAPYVKRLLGVSDELRKEGRILTWLHLSDVHFQDKPGAMKWNQDKIKESFINSLPKLLASWDLSPDLLFFTGDVAFSGEPPQYDLAGKFLEQVRNSINKDMRTYVVPGNHDVCWEKIDDLENEIRESLTNQYEVSSLLMNDTNKDKREKIFSKFESFSSFLTHHFDQYGTPVFRDDYFYIDLFEHSGIELGVAGLNSAWLSTKKGKASYDLDIGQLLLGEPQVDKSINLLDSAQIKFALLHHPPESMWFKDFDRRMQAAFLPRFDFILRGHEHEPVTQATTNLISDDEYIHIAGGALYDATELKGKTGYPICFNAVRINVDSGKGIIFYWRYFSDLYKWTRDVIVEDGFKIFDIPEKVCRRISYGRSSDLDLEDHSTLPHKPDKGIPAKGSRGSS
jgi:hypothetical protein